VQQGRARVKKALDTLQRAAGPSYPVLFLKMGPGDWTPVGEEELYASVKGKGGTSALVICDSDGNSKAMSGWLPVAEAEKAASELSSKGLSKYEGEVKLPV